MSTLRSVSPSSLLTLLDGLAARALAWPFEAQQVSRRNAMIACTDMAQRRAERAEVDEYFASRVQAPDEPAAPADAAHG